MKKLTVYSTVVLLLVVTVIGIIAYQQSSEAKSKHTKKFVALGDSLTYGVGDLEGTGFVGDLEFLLKRSQKQKVVVRNYGIPGQQSDGLLNQLGQPEVLDELEDADYITVFIGMNDLVKSNGYDLYPLHDRRIQIGKKDYERNLQEIFRIVREKNPKAPILFLGLYNPYPDSENIQQVVDDWNETSQDIVKRYPRVKYISTDNLLKEKSRKYFSDSLHPNKKGYQLITRKIVKEYDF